MVPLQGQTLASFQESMYFICYIIIDEMSFTSPNLIQRIDIRLREAFPAHNQLLFGGCSIILFGDLGQLPPVKEIPTCMLQLHMEGHYGVASQQL